MFFDKIREELILNNICLGIKMNLYLLSLKWRFSHDSK